MSNRCLFILGLVLLQPKAVVCQNYGYQGANVPGYGTPGTSAHGVITIDPNTPAGDPDVVPTAIPTLPPLGPVSTSSKPCGEKVPKDCVFPFTYKGVNYTTCTDVDAKDTTWCSKTYLYTGHFERCVNDCNDFPVGAVVGGTIGGAVAVAGAGLITAAVIHNQQKEAAKPLTGPALKILEKSGDTAVPKASLMYDANAGGVVQKELGATRGATGNVLVFFIVAGVALLSFCGLMAGFAVFTARRRSQKPSVEELTVPAEDEEDQLLSA